MAHGAYITETEFIAIKKLLEKLDVSETYEILNSHIKPRALKTLREIKKYDTFAKYQSRNQEPTATISMNGTRFVGPVSECIERLNQFKNQKNKEEMKNERN